ncbi:MAG: hypothetical protein ACKOET_03870 [Verrucomicrobiota bacterium]
MVYQGAHDVRGGFLDPIRVASLEDSAPLRESVRGWLSSPSRLRLLGLWGTLPELLAGLEQEPAGGVPMAGAIARRVKERFRQVPPGGWGRRAAEPARG